MLAKTYGTQNVNGWMISEKLDGVRAIWNGSELVSRNGKRFAAPKWFTDALPTNTTLDGELFMGRGMFQKTVGAVRKKSPVDTEWKRITYHVFDAPEVNGGFTDRLASCEKALSECSVAKVVPHVFCEGIEHLKRFASDLTAKGAEGVMLRHPRSPYERKRSSFLMKYKHTDSAEAEVIGYEGGKGKYAGLVGALVCKWKSITFNVGSGLTDIIRYDPPEIGAKVTFSFNGLTDNMVPRFPVFVCARDYE